MKLQDKKSVLEKKDPQSINIALYTVTLTKYFSIPLRKNKERSLTEL